MLSSSIQDVPSSKSLNIDHSLQCNLRPKSIQYYVTTQSTSYLLPINISLSDQSFGKGKWKNKIDTIANQVCKNIVAIILGKIIIFLPFQHSSVVSFELLQQLQHLLAFCFYNLILKYIKYRWLIYRSADVYQFHNSGF